MEEKLFFPLILWLILLMSHLNVQAFIKDSWPLNLWNPVPVKSITYSVK